MGLNVAATVYKGIKENYKERVKKQYAETYKDENGMVVSNRAVTWEDIKQQIESNNLALGRW